VTALSIITFAISIATLIFSIGVSYAAFTWRFRLVNYRLRQHEREFEDVRKLLAQCLSRQVSPRYTSDDHLEP